MFPFVDRITWGDISPDGKVTPKVYPDEEGVPVHFWPGPAGGKEWTHMAYSPNTGLIYVPVQEVGATATRRRREFKESIPYWGAGWPSTSTTTTDSWPPSTRSRARRSGAGATSTRCAPRR